MSDITVNAWVNDYVYRLFQDRGFRANEEITDLVEDQWSNWKRLMVKSGLNADQAMADDVAFEFSTKRVMGGANRIYEHFADFVLGKPAIVTTVHERETDKYKPRQVACNYCDGRGVVMVPMERYRDDELRRDLRAFKCACEASAPYAGITPATEEMLAWAKKELGIQRQRLYEWSRQFGLDESNPAEFKRQWCAMFRKPEPKKTPKEELKRFEATIKPAPVKAPELVAVGFDIDQEWSY